MNEPCELCQTGSGIFDFSRECCKARHHLVNGPIAEGAKATIAAIRDGVQGSYGKAIALVEIVGTKFGAEAGKRIRRQLWAAIKHEREKGKKHVVPAVVPGSGDATLGRPR